MPNNSGIGNPTTKLCRVVLVRRQKKHGIIWNVHAKPCSQSELYNEQER